MGIEYDLDAPAFYHDASVRIGMDTDYVHDAAHVHIKNQLDLVKASWKKISDTLADLKLGWTGEGAGASDAFFQRLSAAQADMFGVEDGIQSKAGILDLLRYAAVNAAASFGAAEDSVTDLCNKYADGLAAEPSDADKNQALVSEPDGPVAIHYGKA